MPVVMWVKSIDLKKITVLYDFKLSDIFFVFRYILNIERTIEKSCRTELL